jgi:hypothetical protein
MVSSSAKFLWHNYPSQWVAYVSIEDRHIIDPISRCIKNAIQSILWTNQRADMFQVIKSF